MMPGKPPPQDSFLTGGSRRALRMMLGGAVFKWKLDIEPICTVRPMLNTFACNLLITQLRSYVQGSFEIGSCQSIGRAKTCLALRSSHCVICIDALSTIQKRSWREGNRVRKMPYLQNVFLPFLVLSTRDKNTTDGRTEGEKEILLLHSELNPEDQRKCLVCDDGKQKLFRVVGSSHSF